MRRAIAGVVAIAAATAALAATAPAVAHHDGPRHERDGRGHVDRDEPSRRPVTYAVIGDTPYGAPQVAGFPQDIAELNADPQVRLVLHLGDIKNGSTRCDDTYFAQVRAGFDRAEDPLVYTPGDNEWTDCHRANNGAYSPIERLAALRATFFPAPGRTLGQNPRRVEAQAAPYVENVRWQDGRVAFGTLHVVGSDNGWAPWTGLTTQTPEQVAEYEGRNSANIAWLRRIFREAREHDARAVVIGIQADMWDPFFTGANDLPAAYDHFTDSVRELARQARAFRGPVLLLNGDSHIYTDDRPLADPARPGLRTMYGVGYEVPNLRRITVNGSTTPCHEWLRLRVDTRAHEVFSVERVPFATQPGFDPAVCPAA